MKLNPDLIRDILLAVEEFADCDNPFIYYDEFDDETERNKKYSRLKKYNRKEVVYHLRQCAFSGYFIEDGYRYNINDNVEIDDLSPAGHAFLANIRSDTIWKKSKDIGAKIGIFTINGLKDIAIQVSAEIVKAYLEKG